MLKIIASNYGYQLAFVAAVLALITYRFYKNTPNRIFSWFLWVGFVCDSMGLIPYIYYHYPQSSASNFLKSIFPIPMLEHNMWVYNTLMVVYYLVYFYYFRALFQGFPQMQRIMVSFMFVFSAVYSIELYAKADTFHISNFHIAYMTGGVLLLCAIFMLLYLALMSNRISLSVKYLTFWAVFGLLIYNVIAVPSLLISDLRHVSDELRSLFNSGLFYANLFLYIFMCLGLVTNAYFVKKGEKNPFDNPHFI